MGRSCDTIHRSTKVCNDQLNVSDRLRSVKTPIQTDLTHAFGALQTYYRIEFAAGWNGIDLLNFVAGIDNNLMFNTEPSKHCNIIEDLHARLCISYDHILADLERGKKKIIRQSFK